MIRALLVDDDEAILHLFRTVLEMNGFEVDLAKSAAEAIATLPSGPFDVVITDLRMETHTAGFDVVRAAVLLKPRPLVIVVTAFPVPPAEWRKSGADALYVKGSSMMGLPEQIKQLLEQNPRVEHGSSAALRRTR